MVGFLKSWWVAVMDWYAIVCILFIVLLCALCIVTMHAQACRTLCCASVPSTAFCRDLLQLKGENVLVDWLVQNERKQDNVVLKRILLLYYAHNYIDFLCVQYYCNNHYENSLIYKHSCRRWAKGYSCKELAMWRSIHASTVSWVSGMPLRNGPVVCV